jgi:hypothetical protein
MMLEFIQASFDGCACPQLDCLLQGSVSVQPRVAAGRSEGVTQ